MMVENSLFLVLNNITRDTFLEPTVLERFRTSLTKVFGVPASAVYILGVEVFKDPRPQSPSSNSQSSSPAEMLEVAVAVKVGQRYLSADYLKECFYLNATLFADSSSGFFQLYSYDFWDEYLCGSESCKNLERCSIYWTKTNQPRSPIKRKYVTFSGIHLKPNLDCKCPHSFHGTNCDKDFNMCFTERCNKNGKCVSTDVGFSCVCKDGYTGMMFSFSLFSLVIITILVDDSLDSSNCHGTMKRFEIQKVYLFIYLFYFIYLYNIYTVFFFSFHNCYQ